MKANGRRMSSWLHPVGFLTFLTFLAFLVNFPISRNIHGAVLLIGVEYIYIILATCIIYIFHSYKDDREWTSTKEPQVQEWLPNFLTAVPESGHLNMCKSLGPRAPGHRPQLNDTIMEPRIRRGRISKAIDNSPGKRGVRVISSSWGIRHWQVLALILLLQSW